MRLRRTLAAIAVCCISPAVIAATLDLTPLHRNLRYNFGNPGARALGMGGAFLGRADDASAAESNPAGLTIIARPEVTLELRRNAVTTEYFTGIVNEAGLTSHETRNTADPEVSFISVAFPVRSNFALAAYYHVPLAFEQKVSIDSISGGLGTFTDANGVPQRFLFGDLPGDYSIAYRSRTIGIAGAGRVGPFSFGASLRRQWLTADAFADYYDIVETTGERTSVLNASIVSEGTSHDLTYSLGVKWRSASDRLTAGAVYKSGGDFGVRECVVFEAPVIRACAASTTFAENAAFHAPSRLGAGVSVRPAGGLTVNADVVRVQYSKLLDDWVNPSIPCYNYASTNCFVPEFGPNGIGTLQASRIGYSIPNGTELHLGAEWAPPRLRIPFAFRAGWWRDPNHAIEYDPTVRPPSAANSVKGAQDRALSLYGAGKYPQGQDDDHVTFGLGYLGRRYEVNAGYDHSSTQRTLAISMLTRF